MAQYVKLPDNSLFPVAEGEDYATAMRAAYAKYPEAFGEAPTKAGPESGFIPAVKAGFSGLKSDIAALAGRSGIMDLAAAEKYRAEQEQYQKQTFKPTETWGEAPLTKGLELLGGSLPYMAAPLAAGAVPVLAAPAAAAGTAATIGGIAATTLGAGLAGATSAAQFAGSGLSRQVQEGKKLGETELGAAVAAAIPSAALDMVSFKMMPGIRQIFAAAGKEVSEAGARKIAEQGIKETLKDYGASAVKTMGTEGITEAGQQVLERLQASLSLTDEKARDEYLESFIGGAVLGGAISPIGRRFERGAEAGRQEKEALLEKRAAKEEEQRKAKEAAEADKLFKQSDEYALQVASNYQQAEQAKAALLAQKRTITKGSPTEAADRAFNETLNKQLREQAPALKELGAEYARLEPTIKQATEKQRVAGMTPEDYMLEQMTQQEGVPARGRAARLAALNAPIETEETAAPEETYAAERLALAKEQTAITGDIAQDANDYVSYLMTDPAMAQAIVNNQTPLPDFTRKEQNVIRGALKLQLQEREEKRQAAGEAGTAAGQARIGTVEEEEAAAIEARRVADAAEAARLSAERADTERQIKLAPEIEGLRRLGKAPEGAWSTANANAIFRSLYQKQAEAEQVEKLVDTLPLRTISTPGRIYTGLGVDTANRRDLLTALAVARETGNKEMRGKLQAQLDELDAKPPEVKAVGARLPGEGVLPEAEKINARAEQLADAQSQTLQEFVRSLENTRRGVTPGTLRLNRLTLMQAAQGFKDAFVQQHIGEINTRLESFGLAPLSATDAAKAQGRALRALNELQTRWTQAKDTNAPAGQREFGAPVQAVQVLQEQIRNSVFKTINDVADRFNAQQNKAVDTRLGPKPGMQYKTISGAPIEVPRVEQGARVGAPEELTLGQPRVSSDPAKAALTTIDRVLASTVPVNPAHTELLTRVRDALPEIKDPEFISLAQEQALRIAEGRAPDPTAVRDLNSMLRAKEEAGLSTTRPGATAEELQRTSAQPQMELPGMEAPATITQRATPSNFQKMLDSKDVQGLRAAIEKLRTDNEALLATAKKNTPAALSAAKTAKAQVEYDFALAKAQKSGKVLADFKALSREELKGAYENLNELEARSTEISEQLRHMDEVRVSLSRQFDMYKLLDAQSLFKQEKGLRAQLKIADAAVRDAHALIAAIDKVQAADTEALKDAFEENKQIEKEFQAARSAKNAAQKEEFQATNVRVPVEKETREQDEFREAAQRGREGLNLPGIRRLVDTTKMNQQINSIRSAMGSFDAQMETETDPAKKAEIQAKRDKAAAALETVYADAPRITTAIKERDQLALEKAFDDAQIAAYDKVAAKTRIRSGEYGTALANRRQGALARSGPLTVQTGEKRATPATEMAGSALERVAQERAVLRELEAREKFLRDNGKAKSGRRLTEAFKALQAKTEKQRALVRKFEAAQQATVSAVRDVNKEEREARKETGGTEGKLFPERRKGIVLFSRGVPTQGGQTVVSLEKALDKAIGDKEVAGKRIKLFQNVADFFADPAYRYDYEGADIPADAKAFVNPKNGQAFMFADNIAKGEELGVLLHEIGVHLGFRNLFSTAQYAQLVNAVRGWAKRTDNSLESQIAKRAVARVEAAETTADQYDDELLAYTVEEAVKAGVNPAVLQGGTPIRNWLKAVMDVLRKALSKYGINPKTLTTGDLVNMAYGAAQLELRGTWHGSDAEFTAFNTKYAGAGEGAYDRRFEAALSLGSGPYTTPNKEYAEYYQKAVPFGKAANASGYGVKTYQDYRDMDDLFMTTPNDRLSAADVQTKFESRIVTAYLTGVSDGQALDPVQNKNAQAMLERLQKGARNAKEQQAVATLSLQKVKALKEYPAKGNLYRTLDDIPRSRIYSVNSNFKVGERPALDALLAKYGKDWVQDIAKSTGEYPANELFYNMREVEGIKQVTGLLKTAGIDAIEQNNERGKYVERAYIDQAPEILGINLEPVGPATGKGRPGSGSLLFSRKASEENALTSLTDTLVAKPKTFKERMGKNFGLEFEMQTTDMRAGLREALKAGAAAMGDDKLFTQAMYSVIKADQRMPLVQSVMTNGAPELYTDDKGFQGFRSTNKNSAKDVFDAIADIPGKDSEAKTNLFTTYMAVQRAANKGLSKLDLGALGITEEAVNAALAVVDANPELEKALKKAQTAYNAYNEGLINFLASTGAIPKSVAKTLIKDGDYVPFYRVNENGMADLVFSDEVTINIGDIRHQPYLEQLKGGETKILPLNESLPRNTMLLMDKAMTNMATKNVAYALQAMGGDKKMPIHRGSGPAGPNIIRFNQEPNANDPKDSGQRWLRVNTEGTSMEGIPSELVVKSLEGAHLTLPAFLKIGGMAGDLLRAGVTRMPMYLARQLVRDPMAAAFTGGLNYGPLTAVAKAGKEFVAMSRGTSETGAKLMEKGLIQSGIFAGDPTDLSKMALQIASGKDQGALDSLFAKLDRAAMRADAATRTQIYDNAIANGLSEVEADMMVMESMNFYKRGLSPTVQYAARLIPFFNAQIQGLNVLYKAARGQMPFEEQQQIKRKFFNNAMLLVATGIVYAMAMEDDEYFKNAKPKDKYSNFFLHIPGVDEPLKLPIPYEAGWFFSLAVAAADAMKKETDTPQQLKALRDMFLSSVPGYSSMGMPQVIKPVFEVWTNKNFFSGLSIESPRMEQLATQERFRASTTEAAKALSKVLPLLSPIQIEHLATGYFGQLPLIIAGAADALFRKPEAGAAPEKRTTELPFVGQAFQKKYGGADTDVMYREAGDAIEAKATYDKMRKEGRTSAAKDFLADNRAEIASAGLAQNYRKVMGRLRTDEERITGMPNLSAQEKRDRIDKIDAARQDIAKKYEAALKRIETAIDRTTPQ